MANLSCRQLGSFFIAMGLVFLVVIGPGLNDYHVRLNTWLATTLLSVGIVSMVILLFHFDSLFVIHPPSKASQGLEEYFISHSHSIAVVIFGTVSIITDLFYLINNTQCLLVVEQHKSNISKYYNATYEKYPYQTVDQIASVIMNFSEVIFMALSLPFLLNIDKVKDIVIGSSHVRLVYVLLPIIMTNVGIWLYTFFQETGLLKVFPTEDHNETIKYHNLTMACLHHSTVIEDYIDDNLINMYYPMCLEFAIVAVEILLHVWFTYNVDAHSHQVSGYAQFENENESLGQFGAIEYVENDNPIEENTQNDNTGNVTADNENTEYSCYIGYCSKYINKVLGFKLALAMEIVEYVLTVCYITFDESRKEIHDGLPYIEDDFFNLHIKWPIIWFRIIICRIPTMLSSIVCYQYLKKHTAKLSREPELNATDTILITCILSVVLMTGIESFINIIDMKDDPITNAPVFIENTLIIIHYTAQALAIHYGLSRKLRKARYDILPTFEFLAYYNLFRWLVVSAVEVEYKMHHDLGPHSETLKDWFNVFIHHFMPVCIYFRYTSFCHLVRIKDKIIQANRRDQSETKIEVMDQPYESGNADTAGNFPNEVSPSDEVNRSLQQSNGNVQLHLQCSD